MDDLEALRQRGAPAELLAAIVALGLPATAVRGAVERVSRLNRLRLLFRSKAQLSASELTRFEAVAVLARDVVAGEGGADGARRFWTEAMPWLGGRSPAYWLARGDLGAIQDLRVRIECGIPP